MKLGKILLNGSAVRYRTGAGKRKDWVSMRMLQLQVNCVHRADSEPRVHKEFKNDVRFASRTNVLSNKEAEKVNCSCETRMFENSNRSK